MCESYYGVHMDIVDAVRQIKDALELHGFYHTYARNRRLRIVELTLEEAEFCAAWFSTIYGVEVEIV